MSAGVVVDTTVWIHFFRGRNEPVRTALRHLLRSRQVVMVGMVMAEVLQGIRTATELNEAQDHLAALPYFEMTPETWYAAATLSRNLRLTGHTLPLSDLIIAALAMQHDLAVYSTDPHFLRIPGLTRYGEQS